jgi:hypothetical protein
VWKCGLSLILVVSEKISKRRASGLSSMSENFLDEASWVRGMADRMTAFMLRCITCYATNRILPKGQLLKKRGAFPEVTFFLWQKCYREFPFGEKRSGERSFENGQPLPNPGILKVRYNSCDQTRKPTALQWPCTEVTFSNKIVEPRELSILPVLPGGCLCSLTN